MLSSKASTLLLRHSRRSVGTPAGRTTSRNNPTTTIMRRWRSSNASEAAAATRLGLPGSSGGPLSRYGKPFLYATLAGCVVGQYYCGYEKDFYDYSFVTPKDPVDLAGFYGSEAFMDVFCVMPFMGTLMMRGGHFDDDGVVHTTGLPGEMMVSMVFSEGYDEETGDLQWFNKRERFHNVWLGYTCWDMITNFGFETLDDGRVLVHHHGEYFKSRFPPLSLLVRIVFGLHAQWVAWATEHHINHYAFEARSEYEEELEEESRADMPLFLLKNYAWSDLMAGLFGRKVKKPSFLIEKARSLAQDDEEEEEEDKEEVTAKEEEEATELPPPSKVTLQNRLTQRQEIIRRITADIKTDRDNARMAMTERDEEDDGDASPEKEGEKKSLEVGLQRTMTLTRRLTRKPSDSQAASPGLQRAATLKRENLGGNAAWETLRSTNNPEAYRAATLAAQERFLQRRASVAAQTTNEKDEKENDKEGEETAERKEEDELGATSKSFKL